MATHSSILAWKIPRKEEPGGLQSTGLQRVGHDWATNTFTFSGETDVENRLMDVGRREERVRCMERVTWKLTLPHVK